MTSKTNMGVNGTIDEAMSNIDVFELSDEDLDDVAGGTVGELADLCGALASRYGSAVKGISAASAHIPGVNGAIKLAVQGYLCALCGIRADISIGWNGTGIGSGPNKYTNIKTGTSMTHSEVLAAIAAA